MAAAIQSVTNFISSLYAFDQVAVFTQDYVQVFRSARTIKATVKEEAKVMEHPVETGATIVDHRIILPVEIELSLILTPTDYQNTYDKIKEAYLNSTLFIVQTKSGIYENQLIQSMPHDESPDNYNTILIALNLKQVIFVTAQYGTTPKNASNTNTTNRGVQQGTKVDNGTLVGSFVGGGEVLK
jgi:hypothetical protein